jgi:glucosylceramidase
MSIKVTIRPDLELGVWQGIGGAITEATAYNFSKLSKEKQQKLLDAYYGKGGLDYRWGRISIGSNDFCLEPFEYTKRADLADFSIAHDKELILPLIKRIKQQKDITIIASSWSPPSCLKMKRIGRPGERLKPWFYRRYARYLKMWLDAYRKAGVEVDYLSPQNEPYANQSWESCLFSLRALRKLTYKYLVDELKDYEVRFLLWDHNKTELSRVTDGLFPLKYRNEKKVAGLCYHWYDGVCADEMWKVRQKHPDLMMISSEMCCGFSPYDEKAWWMDAKLYLKELFSDINCGASAWIDWNMLLSWRGGPNYCNNFTKAPVILNENEDDFILTPIFEALKTFASLFPAGSEVVRCEYKSDDIVVIVRKNKSRYEAVIANISNKEQSIELKLEGKSKQIIVEESEIIRVGI